MDLRKRLAAMDRLSRKPEVLKASESSTADNVATAEEHLASHLKLVPLSTAAGIVWCRDYKDRLDFPQGSLPDFCEIMTGAHLVDPSLEEIFFLDTETTGLAGGTGTLAFLVGCSWFRDGMFHTRQLFLPGPGQESAILQEIKNLSEGFSVVMTFNGGSFDLPLLRTRALMNRVPDPLAHLVSWDLLKAGRRLWGKSLDNCRQQTIEKNVCGIKRTSADIDGAFIPQTWFDFVATGETEDLEKVLYHNHRDMLGMGSILGKVVTQIGMLQDGVDSGGTGSWREYWALGRICEKRKNQLAAEYWISAAVGNNEVTPDDYDEKRALYQDSIRIIKRSGNWVVVRDVVLRAMDSGIEEAWLYREAAILFEHRLVDLSRALGYALRADDPHRVARLQRKLT